MKYLGQERDINNSNSKTGVLLINLGTPERPVCPGLRKYLGEFLMDPRVIEIPKLLRMILVKGIIINVRSHKSAATYREMRYGKPSVADKIAELHEKGVRKIVAIPLYPQYSGSTNGSTFDAIGSALKKQRWVPSLNFVSDYYQRDSYIKAIAGSISVHWQEHGRNDKLIMSFHGVPQKYITRGDPYQSQCIETSKAVAKELNLNDDEWMLVFQSRFGAEENLLI